MNRPLGIGPQSKIGPRHDRPAQSVSTRQRPFLHRSLAIKLPGYDPSVPSGTVFTGSTSPIRPFDPLAPPNQPPEFLLVQDPNVERARFLQLAAGLLACQQEISFAANAGTHAAAVAPDQIGKYLTRLA